ncbi:HPr(Ser) kinase/phosphatase [[Mycoplasma] mobile]|uniref:Hpr kinase n=1 Tax=Mycoplasma mobile (strain ATCC 43663 / 163K / NCTC 11711) TaxID=267748 RepID=Q6KIA8_MYCM1|nr:HPr(Ser) kinase/phosphatase [[Mycoplasma] mobile]AAT27668.1 Hpr kinase [Mycoplasma mobile 163K]
MQLNKDTYFKKENKSFIYVDKFLEALNLIPNNFEKITKWNLINSPSIKRVGLELAGIDTHNYKNFGNIIVWGFTEQEWFKTLNEKSLKEVLAKVFKLNPPLVILSKSLTEETSNFIIEVASFYSIPVVKTKFSISEIHTYISLPLSEVFAPSVSKHASLVEINGIGVMIIGESGVGKSEAVLELIQKRFLFISDDTVIIKRIGNSFFGYPSEITKGILEVRGLGLMDVEAVYGKEIHRKRSEIRLVVELVKVAFDPIKGDTFDRLGNQELFYEVLDSKIPKIQVQILAGRNTSSLIVAATNLYLAKLDGVDALNIIMERWEK